MKKLITSILLLSILSYSAFTQTYLSKQWDHTFGGVSVETLTGLRKTHDGGFILGGFTNSDSSGEVTERTRGGVDFWIVKTDSSGNKVWDKRFGGNLTEKLYSVEPTFDGGYILGGFVASDSIADVSEPSKGGLDFWIVKTDSLGNKVWDKRFGGTDSEWLSAVKQTADSGYILGGWTYSDSSGDVSQFTNGGSDFWIVKTDKNGIKQWDKRFGGNSSDELYDVKQTTDLGYILGGTTASDSIGDVTVSSRGLNDYWILKTDANGIKLWDNRFGGSSTDNLKSLQQTIDGGFILGGYTYSDSTGDISQHSRDTSLSNPNNQGDAWIVKTNSLGQKMWDKRFGGTWVEDAFGYVTLTHDSGYIIGCASYSSASGDKTENNFGYEQSWIVKIDSVGNKMWDKTIFVGGEDEYAYPIETSEGCYAVGNWSYGHPGAYKTEDTRGLYDFWLVKFCETSTPQLPIADFTVSNTEICQGGCFDFANYSLNAGSFTWLFPGSLTPTSNAAAPTQICYPDSGHYTVTLIASDGAFNDTLEQVDLLLIHALPPATITQLGDTLFAPQGYSSYIWYYNNNQLLNQTNYNLLATQDGDYVVSVIDSNGCPNNDTLFSVHVGLKQFTVNGMSISVYPNPITTDLNIEGMEAFVNGRIQIFDLLGKEKYSSEISSSKQTIRLTNFTAGIYFIEIHKGNQNTFARFVKE